MPHYRTQATPTLYHCTHTTHLTIGHRRHLHCTTALTQHASLQDTGDTYTVALHSHNTPHYRTQATPTLYHCTQSTHLTIGHRRHLHCSTALTQHTSLLGTGDTYTVALHSHNTSHYLLNVLHVINYLLKISWFILWVYKQESTSQGI